MAETLTIYEAGTTLSRAKGENYVVSAPFTGTQTTLKRDVDFGVIPGTKQPSLYKAGAQKIANAFGLLQHFEVESAIENVTADPVVFFYRVRCDLVKIASDGTEYVFTTGHGSANTMERRNGRASAWDSANATLKMAEKRALTAAGLSVSGLSDIFSQDIENEDFINSAKSYANEDPEAPISNSQLKRLYAVANTCGFNAKEAKNIITNLGYKSSKDILQKDFESVLDEFRSRASE